nr:hypothetical protein GCM10020092_019910 [Actinoplanes digitatis]
MVVLSDDQGASSRIASFAQSEQRWMVAVRMVSEGVDIPRLAVGVYATSASTPLYFAQAIGRFVRARRTGETATVFVPSVPHLLGLASEMEAERDHILGARKDPDGLDDDLLERAQRAEDAEGDLEKRFEALSATAELDQVIFDGTSFGTGARTGTPEEEEYLGLPGLLTPDQVAVLLNRRQSEQMAAQKRQKAAEPVSADPEPVATLSAGERRNSLRQPAEHARGGAPPPDRPAARKDPRRAPPPLRRPAERSGDDRAARGAHRHHPDVLTRPGTQKRGVPCGTPLSVAEGLVGVRHHVRAAPNELRVRHVLNRDLHQVLGVPVGVVSAEHQLAATSQGQTELSGCIAAVAPFIGCWSGHRSRRRRESRGHRLPPLVVTDEHVPRLLLTHRATPLAVAAFPQCPRGDPSHTWLG